MRLRNTGVCGPPPCTFSDERRAVAERLRNGVQRPLRALPSQRAWPGSQLEVPTATLRAKGSKIALGLSGGQTQGS